MDELPEKSSYCRMNPNLEELIKRLEEYANITYGTKAYHLSAKEAQILVEALKSVLSK